MVINSKTQATFKAKWCPIQQRSQPFKGEKRGHTSSKMLGPHIVPFLPILLAIILPFITYI
jgi:hypothetical protein